MQDKYIKQVALLVKCLPIIATEECFAIKGGTAINLFCLDLPRLSVDIDLAYLPIEDRDTTYQNINQALERISQKLQNIGLKVTSNKKSEQIAVCTALSLTPRIRAYSRIDTFCLMFYSYKRKRPR